MLVQAKENQAVQTVRRQWTLEQFSLVEAEVIRSETIQPGYPDDDQPASRNPIPQERSMQQSPLFAGQPFATAAKHNQEHLQASNAADAGGLLFPGQTFKPELSLHRRTHRRADDATGNMDGELSGKRWKSFAPPSTQKQSKAERPPMLPPASHLHASSQATKPDSHQSGDQHGSLLASGTRTLRSHGKVITIISAAAPSARISFLRRSRRIAEQRKASKLVPPSRIRSMRRRGGRERGNSQRRSAVLHGPVGSVLNLVMFIRLTSPVRLTEIWVGGDGNVKDFCGTMTTEWIEDLISRLEVGDSMDMEGWEEMHSF